MRNDIVDEFEEAFPEFRVGDEIVLDHAKGRRTQALQNWAEEWGKVLTVSLQDGGEQQESFGITSERVRVHIIYHQFLETWEEVIVEVVEVGLFFDVSLDEFEDISS